MILNLRLIALKQAAFARKGFLIDSSYRLAFALNLVEAFTPLVLLFFVSKVVGEDNPRLGQYGGDYFAFACVGVALTQYFTKALAACSDNIQRAQTSGVLEAMLSTQTGPTSVVLYDAGYGFLGAVPAIAVALTASVTLFGLNVSRANWPMAALGFLCASLAFLAFGLMSAAIVLRAKNGNPIQMLLGNAASFVAGAYFPLSILPGWVRSLARFIPMTHALEILRGSLLAGAGLRELWRPLLTLAAMALVGIPVSLWFLARSIEQARREGTLLQY